ncbi:hypothetical protein NW762_010195 [Fusarium torreyae]|uniref:Uncharacterized protein n=1 Tax=Fusarium torreyae TaxID=1237075 RepID=A0A9W8VBL6_9HYPO|nr:hypothetical protein NW762_010195 [Fusarium torreyae]
MHGGEFSASSVKGEGCTTFYRERFCEGESWQNYGDAASVPDFLNDHMWSFRNQCECPDPFNTCQYLGDDGICVFGFEACMQKMGCSGDAMAADCMGTASGCAIAC